MVKLADFGIAKALERPVERSRRSARCSARRRTWRPSRPRARRPTCGRPLRARRATYQLLSGRLPYEAQSLTELALKQQRDLPPPLTPLNPRGPPTSRWRSTRALALDPRERPASADELRRSLRRRRPRASGPNRPRPRVWRARRPAATTVGAPYTAEATSHPPAPTGSAAPASRQPRGPVDRGPRPTGLLRLHSAAPRGDRRGARAAPRARVRPLPRFPGSCSPLGSASRGGEKVAT